MDVAEKTTDSPLGVAIIAYIDPPPHYRSRERLAALREEDAGSGAALADVAAAGRSGAWTRARTSGRTGNRRAGRDPDAIGGQTAPVGGGRVAPARCGVMRMTGTFTAGARSSPRRALRGHASRKRSRCSGLGTGQAAWRPKTR